MDLLNSIELHSNIAQEGFAGNIAVMSICVYVVGVGKEEANYQKHNTTWNTLREISFANCETSIKVQFIPPWSENYKLFITTEIYSKDKL